MNLCKATNQQLYEIAKDETARMKDRYAAASELQRRKKNLAKKSYREIEVQNRENRWF